MGKNIFWQTSAIGRDYRSAQKQQIPRCLWLTGLSGSGKTTIANILDKKLSTNGKHVYVLDGDNVRHGLNRDLGFTNQDRAENIRRMAEVAKLFVDAGIIVIVCAISPFRKERQLARQLFGESDFLEVFVDTTLSECEKRDVKGLYAKARKGQIPNFTGIDSPYEEPSTAEIHLKTEDLEAEECAEILFRRIS